MPPDSLALSPPVACANCGAHQPAAYCGACGQPTVRERFTTSGLLRRVASDVFDVDRGLLHTALSLFRRPGEAARDYVRGRTVPYVTPLKFFVLSVTLAQLAMVVSGQVGGMADGFNDGVTAHGTDPTTTVTKAETAMVLGQYLALLVAPSVAVLAAAQRLVFRRAGQNYAEHLIFALYAEARAFLSYALMVVVLESLTRLGVPGTNKWVGAGALAAWAVAMFAYYAAAARECFGVGRGRAIVRSAAVAALTLGGSVLLIGIAMIVVDGARGGHHTHGRPAPAAQSTR